MKKNAVLLVMMFASQAMAAKYTLDKSHMEVGFSVKHLMVSNVKGRFEKVDGGFDYDSSKKELKEITAEIETSSVNTSNEDRDKHLRGEDFFATDKFPKMTFKSEKVEMSADGKTAKVTGTLKIKDQSKKVVLDVVNNGETEFMGTQKVGFTATTKISRKDFGLTWNKTLDKGGVAVGDEVTITIEGEGNKVAAAAKK